MGKFKGVLKNISGGLKLAFPIVALVLGIGGAVGIGVPTTIAHSVISKQVVSDYTATEQYQDYIHEKIGEYDEQYQNGEIVLAEYLDMVEKLKEDDYDKIAEIIKENAESNEDYMKKIETLERLKTASISGLILSGVGVVELLTFLAAGKKILRSAENDFEDAEFEFAEAESKKDKKEKEPAIQVSQKPKAVTDISDEKELDDIDEYYQN